MTDISAATGIQQPLSRFKIQQALIEHQVLIWLVAVFNLVGITVITIHDPANLPVHLTKIASYISRSIWFIFAGIGIFALIHLIAVRPKDSPARSIYDALRKGPMADENLLRGLLGYVALILSIPLFVKLKTMIPVFHPFAYDASFEALDRVLHFGQQPWELLQSFLGHPWMTLVIHRLYYFWFPAILLTYYWQIFSRKDPVLRQQFVLSFIACWIVIGVVMATALSSAGPIYYGEVVPEAGHVYNDAMNYLLGVDEQSKMIMFDIRYLLWGSYTGEITDGKLRGISAMPSMHVSIAFLLMLFGLRLNKWFAIGYTTFFVLIFLGSIHLLWHYAVDGYVSIIVTFAIWKVAGYISKRSVRAAEKHGTLTQAAP